MLFFVMILRKSMIKSLSFKKNHDKTHDYRTISAPTRIPFTFFIE